MEFHRMTVGDLFTGTKRFHVPNYQRSYSWKTLQVDAFWKDVLEADGAGVFFGTLILHKSEHSSDSFGIVDGQQRLTTMSILFLALRNYCIKHSFPQAGSIQVTLASTNVATGRTNQLRLEVASDIAAAYRHMVENPDWDGSRFPRDIVDGRVARKVKTIYKFFTDQLNQLGAEDVTNILSKLLSSYFLVVELEDDMQAFEIFERNNARGTPLNVADLIKNRLFRHADEVENFYERWDQIVADAGDNFPRLLKYFCALTKGHDTGKSVLYTHLKDQVHKDGVVSFLAQLESFAEFYRQFNSYDLSDTDRLLPGPGVHSNFLFKNEVVFNRIRRPLQALRWFGIAVPLPVIYASLSSLGNLSEIGKGDIEGARSEFLNLLAVMESYHFINNAVCTKATNRVEQLYAQSAPLIMAARTPKDFKDQISGISKKLRDIGLASYVDFETSFGDISYTNPSEDKAFLAYVFDRFQYGPFSKVPALTIFDPSVTDMVNRGEEVEHIFPKSKWAEKFGENEALNNIGNLIVITQETNRLLGNLDLPEKITILKQRRCDSRVYVQDFVEWVEERRIEGLTPELIRERAGMLAKKAYDEIWNPWLVQR